MSVVRRYFPGACAPEQTRSTRAPAAALEPPAAAGLTHLPLEILPPAIGHRRCGNVDVDCVHRLDSSRPGPEVLAQALSHGDEICGAHVLRWLLEQALLPRRGRLTPVLANAAAFERFDAQAPHRSCFVDEDLNRVWSDAADFVLDIHSMHEDGQAL